MVLVDHFNEVPDNKRDSLNTFELFFGAEFLSGSDGSYLLSLIWSYFMYSSCMLRN